MDHREPGGRNNGRQLADPWNAAGSCPTPPSPEEARTFRPRAHQTATKRLRTPSLRGEACVQLTSPAPTRKRAASKRAFEITFATARGWMEGDLSLVMDMTMYAEFSPARVAGLQPYGVVVNVHTRCWEALARFDEMMRRQGGGPMVEELVGGIQRGSHEVA